MRKVFLAAALFLALYAVAPASAAPAIDQDFAGPYVFGLSLSGAGDGQIFTPAQKNITAVDLFLAVNLKTGLVQGHTLAINLRQADWNGPILASGQSSIPQGTVASPALPYVAHFDLGKQVALVPGQPYFIEFVTMADANGSFRFFGGLAGRLGGYTLGSFVQGGCICGALFDAGFRTFYSAGPPVPAAKDDCKDGAWQNAGRPDGSLFKNQGDCIQYVNKGR